MNDAISRNAVFGLLLRIKAQASVAVLYETISKETEDKVVDIVDMFAELIQNIPALDDVAPVVHARWQDHHCTKCKNEAAMLYECIGDDEGFAWFHSDFCPCCGAKMDGEIDA